MIKRNARITALIMAVLMLSSAAAGCKKNPNDSSSDSYVSDVVSTGNIDGSDDNSQTDGNDSSATDSGKTNSNSSKSNSSKSNSNSSKSSSGSSSSGKTTTSTVKYATWENIGSMEYGPVIKKFTADTKIKVKIVAVPQDNYEEKISSMIAAGNSPDVIKDQNRFPYTIANAQPITNGGVNPSDSRWDPVQTNISTVNGKTYYVCSKQPIFQCRYLLYYNKKLFTANGINSPEDYVNANNWNLETFKKAAQEIKAAAGLEAGAYLAFESFPSCYRGQFFKLNDGKFSSGVLDDSMRNIVTYMLDGSKGGYFKLVNRPNGGDFTSGKAAMVIMDTFGLKANGYFKEMKDSDLGFTYLPKENASDANYPSAGWSGGTGIAKGAKNVEGAGKFINYVFDMDKFEYSDVYKNDASQKFHIEITSRALDSNRVAFFGPHLNKISPITANLLNTDSSQVVANLSKVQNVVTDMVNKANAEIEKNK